MKKTAAAFTAAVLLLAGLPVSAESETMTFRLSAEQQYFSRDQLADGDITVPGGLYIDNYSGINKLRVVLTSDAPLHLDNGDFAWDTSDPSKKNVLAFFKSYSTAMYTQKSVIDDSENIATFIGPENDKGGSFILNGEVNLPDAPFVRFDLRVPADTPSGDYSCGISTFVRTEDIGGEIFRNPDFYAYSEAGQLTEGEDILLQSFPVSVYLRGDVNCDEKVTVEDAQAALLYYTAVISHKEMTEDEIAELFGTKSIRAAQKAADASADGSFDVDDPQAILLYYTMGITGKTASWSDIYEA
ncbi:MAG: hypothetical protein MJ065_02890 [Oscillospiraceae bacterium]|nr:hypothetical protein [Oscillospiraceae bacterium]